MTELPEHPPVLPTGAAKSFKTITTFFWSSFTIIVVTGILVGTALILAWLVRDGLSGFSLMHYNLRKAPYVEEIDLHSVGASVALIIAFVLFWLVRDLFRNALGIEEKEPEFKIPRIGEVKQEQETTAEVSPQDVSEAQPARNPGAQKRSRRKRH